ncbi:NAD-dependent DNA ligase LigA [Kitasatospora sp. NPDC088783]|uniref:NAD-dependent DNA ligase LigA n=1 Tax=Kitasatospora sp. NPDC088783 TaxID=3364077 RepID=UPI00381FAA28
MPHLLPATASRDDYLAAVQQARSAAHAYYSDGTSPLDDTDYDKLLAAITAWENENPGQASADSPAGKVGGGAAPAGDVPHSTPMLSLLKSHSPADVEKWSTALERRLGRPLRGGFAVEAKLDGLAMAARYANGLLYMLLLRGDHQRGEDVSHLIGAIDGLPATLPGGEGTFEVRGEVVMTTGQFTQANEMRIAHGGKAFSNPRNAAAGSVRARNRAYQVGLTFFAHGVIDPRETADKPPIHTHESVMHQLSEAGVNTSMQTPSSLRVYTTLAQAVARIGEIAAMRPGLPFPIDGVVIKANDLYEQDAAGAASDHPYWATAFKLPPVTRHTRLLDVEWNVGRTGVVAPRARLEPVEVDGSVITYATLHNPRFITANDLHIGDLVVVDKAGDIIPRVSAPVVSARPDDATPVVLPTACPNCSGSLDTTGERWRCARGTACGVAAAIRYAVGREMLDIEGLGGTYVDHLVTSGRVADLGDLFTLNHQDLTEATGSSKRAEAILARIDAARTQPLHRVFCALGIPLTGRTVSRRIAARFGSMAAIRAASAEDLAAVPGVAGAYAPLIAADIAALGGVIDKLAAAGVTMSAPEETVPAGERPLTGMAVCVTGSMTGALSGLTRTGVNELIERAGGTAVSGVSKKTTLLVAGANAGSKSAKAAELGVRTIPEEEFATMVAAYLG